MDVATQEKVNVELFKQHTHFTHGFVESLACCRIVPAFAVHRVVVLHDDPRELLAGRLAVFQHALQTLF